MYDFLIKVKLQKQMKQVRLDWVWQARSKLGTFKRAECGLILFLM